MEFPATLLKPVKPKARKELEEKEKLIEEQNKRLNIETSKQILHYMAQKISAEEAYGTLLLTDITCFLQKHKRQKSCRSKASCYLVNVY